MFDALTDRLDGTFKKLRSRGKLHPKQVDNALDDMRTALLEADVAVDVVDDFLARVRARALSDEVMKSLTPAQQVVKIVRDELTATMGGEHTPVQAARREPVVIMMAGVQGSGKTTACAKLALPAQGEGQAPAAGRGRPPAARRRRAAAHAGRRDRRAGRLARASDPVSVAKNALKQAEREGADVVIVDTAGRLHVDPEMMSRRAGSRTPSGPHHVLMACDAMTGQDAVVQARAFMEEVDTTGFILTKLDGDARGGAALSITAVDGPADLLRGHGEKPEDLEPFYPDRMASRILGMGDVLSLIDKAEEQHGPDEAREARREDAAERSSRSRTSSSRCARSGSSGRSQDLLAMLPGRPGRQERAQGHAQVDEATWPGRGHDPSDDPGGAPESRYHHGVPAPADRARIGDHHRRRQRPAQGVRGRAQDDAGHDGGASACRGCRHEAPTGTPEPVAKTR